MNRSAPTRARRVAAPSALLPTVALAAALVVTGCGAGNGASSGAADRGVAAESDAKAPEDARKAAPGAHSPGATGGAKDTAGAEAAPAPTARPAQTHLVRTASLRIEAEATDRAADSARGLAVGAGGYVADELTHSAEEGDEESVDSSRLTIKVPPAEYERLLEDLERLGKVLEREVSSEDVTDQVVDVESRIKTQRASVDRVRRLMDRAEDLRDVVALEGELSRRQADLEALLAQQESLKARTGMATVTLDLVARAQESREGGGKGVWKAFTDALADGLHALYVTFRGLMVFLGSVLPFAVPVLLVLWAARRWLRAGPGRPGGAAGASSPSGPVAPGGDAPAGAREEEKDGERDAVGG